MSIEIPELDVETFLAHHGVKGMHWHQRLSSMSPEQKAKIKKGAKVTGAVIGLGALAVAGAMLAQHGGTPIGSVRSNPSTVKSTHDVVHETLTDVLHASRTKNEGWKMPKTGGVKSPLQEYDKSGLTHVSEGSEAFLRYGDRKEKVAVRFKDPENRTDHATRPIWHDVLLPEHVAKDVSSHAEAAQKAWPLVKDTYNDWYSKTEKRQY